MKKCKHNISSNFYLTQESSTLKDVGININICIVVSLFASFHLSTHQKRKLRNFLVQKMIQFNQYQMPCMAYVAIQTVSELE